MDGATRNGCYVCFTVAIADQIQRFGKKRYRCDPPQEIERSADKPQCRECLGNAERRFKDLIPVSLEVQAIPRYDYRWMFLYVLVTDEFGDVAVELMWQNRSLGG